MVFDQIKEKPREPEQCGSAGERQKKQSMRRELADEIALNEEGGKRL